jgi:hypothetical protein
MVDRLLIIILAAFLFSCKHQKSPGKRNSPADTTVQNPITPIYSKPASELKDTLFISEKAAVFFNPDTIQLKKIKEQLNPRIFDSDMHDCYFQQRFARTVLTRQYPLVHIIDSRNARWLVFKKTNGNMVQIDLDKIPDMCGIYIFEPSKDPQLVEMTNFESFAGFYFTPSKAK